MIIDFFKNLKTHSQIISLSPHCYSPTNLVPGAWFLWPGTSWLVTPRHPQQMVTKLTMGTQCLQSPGPGRISQIYLREVASIQGRDVGYVLRCDPATGPRVTLDTVPSFSPYPRKLVQLLILPSHEKQIKWNVDHIRPSRGEGVYNVFTALKLEPGAEITRQSARASVGN